MQSPCTWPRWPLTARLRGCPAGPAQAAGVKPSIGGITTWQDQSDVAVRKRTSSSRGAAVVLLSELSLSVCRLDTHVRRCEQRALFRGTLPGERACSQRPGRCNLGDGFQLQRHCVGELGTCGDASVAGTCACRAHIDLIYVSYVYLMNAALYCRATLLLERLIQRRNTTVLD